MSRLSTPLHTVLWATLESHMQNHGRLKSIMDSLTTDTFPVGGTGSTRFFR